MPVESCAGKAWLGEISCGPGSLKPLEHILMGPIQLSLHSN